jgi:hypothetical protein
MARSERTVETRIVHLQRRDRRGAHPCQSNDEQIPMDEAEVFGPAIVPRIEEPIRASSNPVRDLPALGRVAEWTGPRIVVQMIWTIPPRHRQDATNSTGDVLRPVNRRNDMVDLKSTNGGEQTILAGVAGSEANGQSHQWVTSSMSRPSREMSEDRFG